ncbi:hypothetical protein OMR07_30070, partial [Methylobacterium organophilum]|nr:hypothetical protein [Methylobacterium organophilum]
MPALVIDAAGPGITLQDGGRHGYLRYGITAAGPMDPLMHAAANRAASNALDATAVEISTGGVTVSAQDGAVGIALLAPGFRVALDQCADPLPVRRGPEQDPVEDRRDDPVQHRLGIREG